MAKILIVDDQIETLESVKDLLESERHTVDSCLSASEAWDFIKTYKYDLFIFDWEMPETSGIELLQKYRTEGGSTPVIMLTGRKNTPDKIRGLDHGADNYLTKPFESSELLSFVRAMLRREVAEKVESISYGDLVLDPQASRVSCAEKSTNLTSRELDVLKLLLTSSGRLISHEELQTVAYKDSAEVSSTALRVFLTGLREKLSKIGSKIQILNVRGYGYQIKI